MYPGIYLVLIASSVAFVTDVRVRRIPNWITIPLAISGLILAAFHGPFPFIESFAIGFAVLMIGFVAFSMGWLGGGDVKLLAASATALTLHDELAFLVYTSIGGGILAIIIAMVMGRLGDVFKSAGMIARPFLYKGTVAVAPKQPITLPYGCAIAFGAAAVACSHTIAPILRLPF